MKYLLIYLIIINIIATGVMAADKHKARYNRWRISEKTLFLLALAGGSIGVLTGMKLFHHKTRHLSFTVGIPAILIIQLLIVYLISKGGN
ncbi:MAG: DUF1294 domain-containing protein [Erysipelotrichaceae bacterium]|nr:DUF1294 domain-containing protein [Erysipelotrichaceae bacterium]